MRVSETHFDPALMYWQDYLPLLQQFAGQQFPTCAQLNSLLSEGLSSHAGHTIRFVPSNELDDGGYEHRIYTSGQVSTRVNNWHDLFNALVWIRFPQIKTAMNALHFQSLSQQAQGSRGKLRDALTLFDECGTLVLSSHTEILTALSERQWSVAFQDLRSHWGAHLQVAIIGHAMLEKYLTPYKSMTAKALLIHISAEHAQLGREELLDVIDRTIAKQLLAGSILSTPACLTPLPLAGIPGWWPEAEQGEQFYNDRHVFRPAAENLVPTQVTQLG